MFTINISGTVKKKLAKPSIILNRLEEIIQLGNKSTKETKTDGKLWYDLLESIFITIKLIRRSYDHDLLSLVCNSYKSSLRVEIDEILLKT